jgi:hypothetical protein
LGDEFSDEICANTPPHSVSRSSWSQRRSCRKNDAGNQTETGETGSTIAWFRANKVFLTLGGCFLG